MLDYAQWVQRARRFVLNLPEFAGLAPLPDGSDDMHIEAVVRAPLKETAVARLEKKLSCRFPPSLRGFFLTGSRNCHCSYCWTLPQGEAFTEFLGSSVCGGATLCDASAMPEHREWFHWIATHCDWVSNKPKEQKIWLNAIPLIYMPNGDHIALDLTKGNEEPPVIYLGDTDGHVVISPCFDDFLQQWEGVCYLGPELDMLSDFFDKKRRLNANSKKAAQVRRFFGITDWAAD